jgi:protein-S-isoprenylcysteine O-methyltransferase Ste14
VRATRFEFNYRFWIIAILFWIGFSLYRFGDVNFGVGLLKWIAPSVTPDSPRGNSWLRLIFLCGAVLVFLAALLRTWATAYLRAEVVHDSGLHSEALVADGPYRYVRNPLYLGTLLMTAGLGMMASRLGWLVLVLGMCIFQYRLILREEHELVQSQGESFRAYLGAVPRLLPALRPRVRTGGTKPRWAQALVGEMFFWLFGAAMVVFSITLRAKPAVILIGISLAGYVVLILLLKRRGQKAVA